MREETRHEAGAAGERRRHSAASGLSALLGAIVGRRTVDAMDRHRMAILLVTLVLLVLASPDLDGSIASNTLRRLGICL